VIFISHKLKEVLAIADTVTVMRDGKVVETMKNENLSEQGLARLMVAGRELFPHFPPTAAGRDDLEAQDITYIDKGHHVLNRVSFQLKGGEILGLAGVDATAKRARGDHQRPAGATAGVIRIRGVEVTGDSPRTSASGNWRTSRRTDMKDGGPPASAARPDRRPLFPTRVLQCPWTLRKSTSTSIPAISYETSPSKPRHPDPGALAVRRQHPEGRRWLASFPRTGDRGSGAPHARIDVGSEEMIHAILAKSRDRGQGVRW